jgi:hypothetical protein
MTIKIEIEIAHQTNGDYESEEILIKLDGRKIFSQSACESLSEHPEDALFYRDLNRPSDIIDVIEEILKEDKNYEISIVAVE